jgi:hypothetical protein
VAFQWLEGHKGRVHPKIRSGASSSCPHMAAPGDIYSHVLPGMGDGAVTANQALPSESEDVEQPKG